MSIEDYYPTQLFVDFTEGSYLSETSYTLSVDGTTLLSKSNDSNDYTVPITSSQATKEFTLTLFDSFGDGWNGFRNK